MYQVPSQMLPMHYSLYKNLSRVALSSAFGKLRSLKVTHLVTVTPHLEKKVKI